MYLDEWLSSFYRIYVVPATTYLLNQEFILYYSSLLHNIYNLIPHKTFMYNQRLHYAVIVILFIA